jgi:hypothetical protein
LAIELIGQFAELADGYLAEAFAKSGGMMTDQQAKITATSVIIACVVPLHRELCVPW